MDAETRPRGRVRLSQKMIETLPPIPPETRRRAMDYSDADVVGLRLSVSRSRKFFDFRYKYNHRKRCMRLGEWPGLSLQRARELARECRNKLYQGIDPSTEREKRLSVMSFRDFIEQEYLPFAYANKKSAKDDENKLRRDLLPAWGKLPLTAITTKDVQKVCTEVRTRSSAGFMNRYYALIHRIFNLAILWGRLDGRNPAKGVAKAKESAGRERFLSGEELERFLAALDNCADDDFAGHAFLRLLLLTGVRCGEALSIKWQDVSFERSVVFLPTTKSGRSRTVMLNDLAKGVLQKMLERRVGDHPYVFPGVRPGTHMAEPRRVFDKVKETAKIEKSLRLHDLRHSFASICVQNGASLFMVQQLLGHSSSAMTQRYSHLSDNDLRAVTNGVADRISQATG